jgi:hypothetical protein
MEGVCLCGVIINDHQGGSNYQAVSHSLMGFSSLMSSFRFMSLSSI